MKLNFLSSLRRAFLPTLITAAISTSAYGQAYYWDPSTTATANVGSNGLLSSGAPATGTWNTSSFWSQNPISTTTASYVAFSATGTNPDVIFNTGTNQSTSSTVNVSAGVSVNSLTISGSEWTFAGTGAITIGAGGLALSATPPSGVQYITQAGATTTSTGLTTYAASLHGAETFNTPVIVGATETWTTEDAANNSNQLVFSNTVTGPTGGGTLTLSSATTQGDGFAFSNVIANGSGGALALTVNNLGSATNGVVSTQIAITGTTTKASTYTGATTIQAGTLAVSSLQANGTASDLGSGTQLNLGSGSTAGSLVFIGTTAGSSTNRAITIGGTGGGILNDTTTAASGLNLSGNIGTSMAGSGTLTLGNGLVASAATTNTISGTISDGNAGGSNTGTLSIASADTTTTTAATVTNWNLTGVVNIAGNVNVNGGTFTFTQNDTLGNITVGTSGSALNPVIGNVVLNGNTTSSVASQSYTLAGGLLTINGSSDNKLASVSVTNNSTLTLGANGTLGSSTAITLNGGFLLLSSANNIGGGNTLTIGTLGGGIGVNNYTPTSFPSVTFLGTGVGVYGLGGTGTGGIGSVAAINALFQGGWSLGAFTGTNGTYTGSSLPTDSNNNYNIGGGGATITIASPILTGSNNLVIGGSGGGTVALPSGNTYTGTTTISNGTVSFASGSSFGTASTAINVGSAAGSQVLGINYAGVGENFGRALNFQGSSNTITFSNNGSGNINYTGALTFGGTNTIILGNPTDSQGGSIAGSITGGSTVTKKGLTNSVWSLTGGSGNTYTGNTTINGGVLQTTNASDLATSNLITLTGVFSGTPGSAASDAAVWQTQGTLTNTLGTAATDINWGTNAGFSAFGGTLTLNFNGGAALVWGAGNFSGVGGQPLFFGSTTSNNQVIFTNSINENATDGFNNQIYVEKGVGGDSTLISGLIFQPAGTNAAAGILKSGKGTLILSNANNSYSGQTIVDAGTLIAAGNSAAASGTGVVGVFGSGYGASSALAPLDPNIILGDGNTGTGGNPTLLIGGAYNIGRGVLATGNSGTNNTYGIGGSTDASSTFSGQISFTNTVATGNTFAVTQVATTGSDALNITGGIAGTGTMSFNNVGAVNVSSAITGTTTVTQAGSGVTTLSASDTYSGATTVNAGTLVVNGATGGNLTASSVTVNGGIFAGPNGAIVYKNLTQTGGTISTVDGSYNTLAAGSLVLNGGTVNVGFTGNGTTSLALDTIDTSALSGTLTIGAGSTKIVITNNGGTAVAGNYALLTYSGTQLTGLGGLSLASGTFDGFTATLTNGLSPTDDTVYLTLTAIGGGGPTPTTYSIAVVAGSTLLHQGATTTVTTTLSNTGSGTDTLNYTGLGATSSTSNGLGAGNNTSGTAVSTSGAPNQQTYTATNTGADSVGATVSATETSSSAAATGTVTGTTINVYSGQSTWAGTGASGSWGIIGGTGNSTFGTNWGATQGSPGVTSGFTSTDTATFGTIASQSTELVRLDGASPSLSSLAFNSATTSYTIAQGSGGNITFNGGAGSASLSNTAGSHTISAPVALATNLGIATSGGATTTISGAISGGFGITDSGAGTTVLAGPNTFSGGLSVTAGQTNITGGVAGVSVGAGTGAIGVGTGATLGLSGVIGNTVTLATGSGLDTVLGQTGPTVAKGGTVVAGGVIDASAGNVTLTFALGTGGSTNAAQFNFAAPNSSSTYLTVQGSTAGEIKLALTDTIVVNDLSSGSALTTLSLDTPYLLIQAGSGTLADNNDYSGITTSGGVIGGVLQNGWVTGASNGNSIGLAGTAVTGTYAARLYLYDGDLELVPEPSTWAMMIGGLALLIFVQRRKSKSFKA